jgi:1,2-diacylglycerol 3-alpha-glucosyltransferase
MYAGWSERKSTRFSALESQQGGQMPGRAPTASSSPAKASAVAALSAGLSSRYSAWCLMNNANRKKSLKIVFATDQYWPRISGMSVSIDAFASDLEKAGHKVAILAPEYRGAVEFDALSNRRRVFRFKSHGVFFSPEDKLVSSAARGKIYQVLERIAPDIIHVQSEFRLGRAAAKFAVSRGIPLVMTAHTNWEELIGLYLPLLAEPLARKYARLRLGRTYNSADRVIVPTGAMRDLLLEYKVGVPIAIIPTGVQRADFELCGAESEAAISCWRERYPELGGKRILLTAGRIGEEKNLNLLLGVMERLRWTAPDAMLVIAGDGPYREALERSVRRRRLEDGVLFLGFVARSRMKELYGLSDAFVFASRVESQGMVVIESMMAGTPVVAIGEMGTRELMGGDNGGFMVEADEGVFAEKVRHLLADPELRRRNAEEAFRHAQGWTNDESVRKVDQLYRELATSRP